MKFNSKHLAAAEANLNNPIKILLLIGEVMRSRIANAFANQARGNFKWRERGVPNIMGIIDDLGRGSTIKGRRFEQGKSLMDTGNLLRSFGRGNPNMEIPNKNTIEVGTPVPYAGTLNVGGTSEKDVTKTVKKNLSIYLKTKKGKTMRSKIGWLFSRDTVKVNIVARPFAIVTEQDMQDIVKIIKKEFTK